jgi:hypothetical protein
MSQKQFEQLQTMVSNMTPTQLRQIQKTIDSQLSAQKKELINDEESDFIRSLFN